jgi:hypothetical protein
MTYQAPPDMATAHPLPDMIPLIEANARRFDKELRAGYAKLQAKVKKSPIDVQISEFDAWVFVLIDEVFQDMLEAKVNHASAAAYTEEVGRRLDMKIKKSIRNAAK